MKEKQQPLTRREFVKGTGVLLGGMAAGSALVTTGPAAAASKDVTVPQSTLGRTGEKVSRLGIGCAHFRWPAASIQDVHDVLYRALELGVNYLDVAPNYGDEKIGFSETKMGPTIKEIRDRVFLITKTEEPTYEGTWRLLRQSMKRLKTDHFDLVHLHNLGNEERFPDLKLVFSKKGALGALQEAKQKGVVRYIGASGHLHPSRFHAALDTGQIDVVMNAVNLVVQHVYDFEHKLWARARQENIALVAMKVLGGAGKDYTGFRLPEDLYTRAVRYACSIPGLSCVVIGVRNIGELEKAATTVTQAEKLSESEAHEVAKVGLELAGQEAWKAAYGKPTL